MLTPGVRPEERIQASSVRGLQRLPESEGDERRQWRVAHQPVFKNQLKVVRGEYARACPRQRGEGSEKRAADDMSEEDMCRRALEDMEQQLGPHHPRTLGAVQKLAQQLERQGELAEAEPLYRRALEGVERLLRADHPIVLMTVCGLAGLLEKQVKLAEAEPLCRRALEGRERQLGAQHLDTLLSVHNLAHLLRIQGRLAEAEPL